MPAHGPTGPRCTRAFDEIVRLRCPPRIECAASAVDVHTALRGLAFPAQRVDRAIRDQEVIGVCDPAFEHAVVIIDRYLSPREVYVAI